MIDQDYMKNGEDPMLWDVEALQEGIKKMHNEPAAQGFLAGVLYAKVSAKAAGVSI